MKSLSIVTSLGIFLLSTSSREAAQQPVGSTLVVVNLVTAAFNRDTRTLRVRAVQRELERVRVGGRGGACEAGRARVGQHAEACDGVHVREREGLEVGRDVRGSLV